MFQQKPEKRKSYSVQAVSIVVHVAVLLLIILYSFWTVDLRVAPIQPKPYPALPVVPVRFFQERATTPCERSDINDGIVCCCFTIDPPVLIHREEPTYPELARRMRLQGMVILEAVITKAGTVEDVQMIHSAHAWLTQVAVDAVSKWRYKPALLCGRPIRCCFTITIRFSLQ